MIAQSTRKKTMVNLMKLGFLITLYTVSDIIAWGRFLELYSLILVGILWTRSIAVPSLLWLFNYMSVESLMYYVFQGKLPPYSMPWLSIGTSTNLYIMSAIFGATSILLIWGEAKAINLLKRVMYLRSGKRMRDLEIAEERSPTS